MTLIGPLSAIHTHHPHDEDSPEYIIEAYVDASAVLTAFQDPTNSERSIITIDTQDEGVHRLPLAMPVGQVAQLVRTGQALTF